MEKRSKKSLKAMSALLKIVPTLLNYDPWNLIEAVKIVGIVSKVKPKI